MKKSILVSTSTFAAQDVSPLNRLEEAGFNVKLNPFKRKLSKDEFLGLISGCVGLIAGLETLDHEVMTKSKLKVISRCGVGMDNVDLEVAQELGIIVLNTPDAPTKAVAELTLTCMLNLLRQVNLMDLDLHKGQWNKRIGFLLEGKTILIVGFGRIGRRLSELLAPFNVEIIVVDPFVDSKKIGFRVSDLKAALPLADITTLHSNTKECLISKEEFDLMKKGAFLLNSARGHLIDEGFLVKALKENRLSGAWIDTYESEPYSGILTEFPQVLLTPHVSSYAVETRKSMELEATNNLISAFKNFETNV